MATAQDIQYTPSELQQQKLKDRVGETARRPGSDGGSSAACVNCIPGPGGPEVKSAGETGGAAPHMATRFRLAPAFGTLRGACVRFPEEMPCSSWERRPARRRRKSPGVPRPEASCRQA